MQVEKQHTVQADLLLLLVALIWGFGFVAQRAGMDHIGPYTYNGIRFLLGGVCLLPLVLRRPAVPLAERGRQIPLARAGLLAGIVLFLAATLQQVGLQYTTAGKAGFITGLYVVLVPIIGMAFRQRTNTGTWVGAAAASAGLYLLSVNEELHIEPGDLLELIGALFWAVHVLLLSWLSPRTAPVRLALVQVLVCGVLSLVVTEQNLLDAQTNYLAVVSHMPAQLSRRKSTRSSSPPAWRRPRSRPWPPTRSSARPTRTSRPGASRTRWRKARSCPRSISRSTSSTRKTPTTAPTTTRTRSARTCACSCGCAPGLFNGWKDVARKQETFELINEAQEIRNPSPGDRIHPPELAGARGCQEEVEYLRQQQRFAAATASAYTKQWNIGERTLLRDVLDAEAERIDAARQLTTARPRACPLPGPQRHRPAHPRPAAGLARGRHGGRGGGTRPGRGAAARTDPRFPELHKNPVRANRNTPVFRSAPGARQGAGRFVSAPLPWPGLAAPTCCPRFRPFSPTSPVAHPIPR